jgi:hypothetical protein
MRLVTLIIPFILATLPVCSATGPPEDFDMVVSARGPEYEAARDRLLKAADFDIVTERLKSDSSRQRIMAAILQGYRAHAKEYAELRRQWLLNRRGEKRFTWSTDSRAVKAEYLPLMYEFLTKDVEGSAGRDAAVRVTTMLARQGTAPDVNALFDFVRGEGLPEASRTAVARTISAMPTALVRPDDLVGLLEAEGARGARSQDVARALVDGLVASSAALPESGKDAVVTRLLKMDRLRALVGEATFVRTVGGVGGSKAVPAVSHYLEQTQSPSMGRWAISVLGSIGDDTAATSLLKCAGSPNTSADLKMYSIRKLSNVKYSERVGKGLEAIATEAGRGDRERAEAIDTLVKLHEAHPRDESARREIRSHLEALELPSAAGEALREKLRRAKQSLH